MLLGGRQQLAGGVADLLAAASDLADQTTQVGQRVGEGAGEHLERLVVGLALGHLDRQVTFGCLRQDLGQRSHARLQLVAFSARHGAHCPDRLRQHAVEPGEGGEHRQHQDQPGDIGRVDAVRDERGEHQARRVGDAEQDRLPLLQRRGREQQRRQVEDPERAAEAAGHRDRGAHRHHRRDQQTNAVGGDASADVGAGLLQRRQDRHHRRVDDGERFPAVERAQMDMHPRRRMPVEHDGSDDGEHDATPGRSGRNAAELLAEVHCPLLRRGLPVKSSGESAPR